MTMRDSYTPEEWQTLQFALLWTLAEATGSDEVGIQPDIGDAPMFGHEPLAREVVSSLGAEMQDVLPKFRSDPRTAQLGLGDVAGLLDRKATASQAQNFKVAMLDSGQQLFEMTERALDELGDDAVKEAHLEPLRSGLVRVAAALGVSP